MTVTAGDDRNEPDGESDRRADAMKDQLRKDVASWSAARADASDSPSRPPAPVVRQQAAPQSTRRRAKPVEVAKPVVTEKKPFRMFEGSSDRDYIAHRIKLGAR